MTTTHDEDRRRLAAVVLAVLVSQVLLYPGVDDLVVALGSPGGIDAGMWFLVAEFSAFVAFAAVWGALSDALGRRVPLVVLGAFGGAASYLLLTALPGLGVGFEVALLVRLVGGALTIAAFSLSITMLMDLSGGHGRNMGAAGIAIGLGAAVGSTTGGVLADLDPFYPVYAAAVVLVSAGLLAATVPDRAGKVVGTDASGPAVAADPRPDPGAAPATPASPGTPASEGPILAGKRGSAGADARPEVGFRDVLARTRSTPALFVPFAFGFIDRLTAGFFSLVGIYYFRDVFELSATGAGATLALFFVPFALLQYPFGSLSDRIGRFYPVVGGSLAYGAVVIGVGIAPTYAVAAGMMVLVGVCGALVAPATMALVTDLVDVEARGAAMGAFNVFGSLGFLTGFLVGGGMAETFGYVPAFLVVGGLELLIALLLFPVVKTIAPHIGSHAGEQPSRPGDT
ncbi:MFS transporter [Halorubrum gandharaense]